MMEGWNVLCHVKREGELSGRGMSGRIPLPGDSRRVFVSVDLRVSFYVRYHCTIRAKKVV